MINSAHFEAARRGNVNDFPFSEIHSLDVADIFHKVSPLGNSLLHVAAGCGNLEITALMSLKFPFLITQKNSQGDTALHFAVKAEKLNTSKVLVECAKQISTTSRTGDTLLSMKNNEGNTPLHVALLALEAAPKGSVDNFVAVARYLISEDPEVSYGQNKASKSPLYLAIESNNIDIVEYILRALPQDSGRLDRLEGKNPVHVAIDLKRLDFLREMKEQKEELLLLVDDEENTPLHYAASVGYLEGVRYLLEINNDWAFERNKKGLYPAHLACENGHVQIMMELLEKWPDATEFLCNKDRSILHVAAMSGKEEAVRRILNEKALGELVKKMDKDGNTPLHLAALGCNPLVVATLLWDQRSKIDLVNYQGLTAYDIFNLKEFHKNKGTDANVGNLRETGNADKDYSKTDLKRSEEPNDFKKKMTSALFYVNKKRFSPKNGHSLSSTNFAHVKGKPRLPKEDLNNRINNLFVVAALIVGSAYAGTLQMSFDNGTIYKGGKDSDLMKSNILREFLSNNVAAMILSITASFTLCSALLLDDTLAKILVKFAFSLLVLALSNMASAFSCAIALRMQTCDIHFFRAEVKDFALQVFQWLLVSIPLMTLALGGEALTQLIYFLCFCVYFLLHELQRRICSTFPHLDYLRSRSVRGGILVCCFILFVGAGILPSI